MNKQRADLSASKLSTKTNYWLILMTPTAEHNAALTSQRGGGKKKISELLDFMVACKNTQQTA